MSNYTKTTNFAIKDGLATGNPSKIIKGSEHDTEYTNIATAIASKADTSSLSTYAPLSSPTFTGTPAAPNPTTGARTTQIATMQKFSDEFSASKTSQGYQKLPSGLIIQWGLNASVGTSSGNLSITLPTAFPTGALWGSGTVNGTGGGGTIYTVHFNTSTTTTATFTTHAGGNIASGITVDWMVIGH